MMLCPSSADVHTDNQDYDDDDSVDTDDNVKKIIALDPVDSNPRELTEPRLSPKTNLTNSQAEEIHLFQSEKGGSECPKDRNASIVKELYPNQITSFEINLGAVHMSYEDSRDDEKSINARDSVHNKIHSVIS